MPESTHAEYREIARLQQPYAGEPSTPPASAAAPVLGTADLAATAVASADPPPAVPTTGARGAGPIPQAPAAPPGRGGIPALHQQADIGPLRSQGGTEKDCFDRLALLAEPENWSGHGTTAKDPTWTLREYVESTFERLHRQRKILTSPDGSYCVFNSGLVSPQQEALYGLFTPNRNPDGPPWQMSGWFPESEPGLHEHFPELPGSAVYTADPADLVYDWRRPLSANPKHLLESQANIGALPGQLRDNPYQAGLVLEGAVRRAEARIRRNYRAAVPCWDPERERVQLLLPLSLTTPETVDVALAVSRESDGYRGNTMLPLDLAYARARLIGRPDEWLGPL